MELFIQVSFWITIVSIVLKMIIISGSEYPRKVNFSLGQDLVGIIITIAWSAWSGILLWGN